MSHACALVVVPAGTKRADAAFVVAPILAPFREEDNVHGWWDWWQVGGRYTGLYAEYDPTKDPRNTEACNLCNGTGTRPGGIERFGQAWAEGCGGCNGCGGAGKRAKWPTHWAQIDEDVLLVPVLLNNPGLPLPYSLVTPDGAFHREVWAAGRFIKDEDWPATFATALSKHPDTAVVVVDYHT